VRLLGIRLTETECLLRGSSIEKSFSSHGNGHEGMGLRCYGIANEMGQPGHRVAHHPSAGIVEFQMQMRAGGITGITADGHQVACLDRKLFQRETNIQRVAPSRSLQLLFVDIGKALQMAIDASIPIKVSDIKGITKPVFIDRQTTDIALGNSENLLALDVARLDIQPTMEMPGTGLAEVACQHDLIVDGRLVIYSIRTDRTGLIAAASCQYQYSE